MYYMYAFAVASHCADKLLTLPFCRSAHPKLGDNSLHTLYLLFLGSLLSTFKFTSLITNRFC